MPHMRGASGRDQNGSLERVTSQIITKEALQAKLAEHLNRFRDANDNSVDELHTRISGLAGRKGWRIQQKSRPRARALSIGTVTPMPGAAPLEAPAQCCPSPVRPPRRWRRQGFRARLQSRRRCFWMWRRSRRRGFRARLTGARIVERNDLHVALSSLSDSVCA